MDIIASIKLIENTLGKRYQDQPWHKSTANKKPLSTQKNTPQADQHNFSAWDEIQPGRNIDISA